MTERKIWLVGEHNPYGVDPRYALFPAPSNSAGGRLCALLQMGRQQYIATFERRNLVSRLPWRCDEARAAAKELLLEMPRDAGLLMLGAKVCAAFGHLYRPFEVWLNDPVSDLWVAALPHPSGRCRAWNDPTSAERARATLRLLSERC